MRPSVFGFRSLRAEREPCERIEQTRDSTLTRFALDTLLGCHARIRIREVTAGARAARARVPGPERRRLGSPGGRPGIGLLQIAILAHLAPSELAAWHWIVRATARTVG